MQKRLLPLMAAALVAVIFFSSCSKNNKQGRYIPETAGVVIHINGASVNEKLPWEEIKKNEMFTEAMSDTSLTDFQKQLLNDPENSGVNYKTDMEFFVVKDSAGGYVAFEGSIKDKAKFKTFITTAHKEGKETVKDDYTYYSDHKGAIAYNGERFFAAFNAPMLDMMNRMHDSPLSTDTTFGTLQAPKEDRDMNAVAASLISLKEDNSLAKSKKFSELMDTKGDIHFWYSAEHFNTMGNLGAAAAMINLDKLTVGLINTATVNFDNGKITLDGKLYACKELTDLYKKYEGGDFDKSMLKNIPSQNLAGFFALNFKPEGIAELLKMLNLSGMANLGLTRFGFSIDDFIKANKGDIMLAVTDLQNDTPNIKDPNFIFSASIGDKASFQKLVNAGKQMSHMGMEDSANGMGYAMNDKYFAISNNKAFADSYIAGNAKSSFSILDKIENGPVAGYADLQYILKNMPSARMDSSEKVMLSESLKIWENVIMSGGQFRDGGLVQHWEANMVDKSTNSLKQLNTYFGKLGKLKKEQQKKWEENWKKEDKMADTVAMMPPPPPAK